jgi:phospholipase C
VHLRNPGSEPLTAAVQDNSYKTGTITKTVLPGHEASVVLQLGKTHGWYDFSVKANGSEIEARFAGRVETSRTSISDPLMGGAV